MNPFLKAKKIAIIDIKINYGDLGIYAGPYKHKQYWARDSFITSLGACTNKDFAIVKINLDTFAKYQRLDGHIPARVEENYHQLTLLGIKIRRKKPIALHKQTQPWANDVVDSNSWYLISALNYIQTSKDKEWLRNNKKILIKSSEWLISNIHSNGLLYEGFTGNWSDCNLRRGYMIYNNVLAWKAIKELASLLIGEESNKYTKISDHLKESIITKFWDEELGYFIDRIDRSKKYRYFYSDGNLLAIWFGLVGKVKGKRIIDYIDKNGLNKIPVPSGYPKMDWWNNLINKAFFPMYRTKNTFTWWGCVSALARLKIGDNAGAIKDLKKVAEKIVEYDTCHEVLTPDGKPVDLWFYKSERRIAWTAGMYLYTYEQFYHNKLI